MSRSAQGVYIMKGITKVLGLGMIAVVGTMAVVAPLYAATYDDATNTITADGTGLDGENGAAFVANDSTSLTVKGTLENVRGTLIDANNYMSGADDGGVTAFRDKLASLTSLTLDFMDNATQVQDADLAYIQTLVDTAGNDNDPVVNVIAEVLDLSLVEDLSAATGYKFGTVTVSSEVVVRNKTQFDSLVDAGAVFTEGTKVKLADDEDYFIVEKDDELVKDEVTTPANTNA